MGPNGGQNRRTTVLNIDDDNRCHRPDLPAVRKLHRSAEGKLLFPQIPLLVPDQGPRGLPSRLIDPEDLSRIAVAWILGGDFQDVDILHLPLLIQRQIVSLLAAEGETLFRKVCKDLLFSQKLVVKVRNLSVETVDVVDVKLAWRKSLAPFLCRAPADPSYGRDINI